MQDRNRTPYDDRVPLWDYEDKPDCEEDDYEPDYEAILARKHRGPADDDPLWPYTLDDYQQAVGIEPWE